MSTPAAEPQRLIQLNLETADFSANWSHCDQISTYLARVAGSDSPDAFLHTNLLSTVLNELLEIAFENNQPQGALNCSLERRGHADRVVLQIPVNAGHAAFYRDSIAKAQQVAVNDLYLEALLGENSLPPGFGFMQLAVDFGAKFELEDLPGDILQIVSEFELEGDHAN